MEKLQIDPNRQAFGRRLAGARELKGYSQSAIAGLYGLNKATVSAWETGRADPGVFRLKELADLYETTCDELLGSKVHSLEAQQLASEFDALPTDKRKQLMAVWAAFIGN